MAFRKLLGLDRKREHLPVRLQLEGLEPRILLNGTPATIYEADMEADPGWTLDLGAAPYHWEWGAPAGEGSHDGDPSSGHTGNSVMGYNLSGDYPDDLESSQFATTPPIDCSGHQDVSLSFYRWLGVESSWFDEADIQVSNDGSAWVDVWRNGIGDISDDDWRYQQYDVSAVADEQATVYIRWGMGPTDGSVTYPGWNIDDVSVTGVPVGPDVVGPAVAQHTPSGVVGPGQAAVRFDFDEGMDTFSFDPADDVVSFDGPSGDLTGQITGWQWIGGDTLEIQFDAQSEFGAYTMVIGPDITDDGPSFNPMNQNGNGVNGEVPGDRYTATFEITDVTKDWTFMVYLDGDNDLEDSAIDDFLEMASAGSDGNVNIVVQLDRIWGYDSRYDNWTDTRRGIVMPDDVPDLSWGVSVGEANMGDPHTLTEFVNWAVATYPANSYALIPWDHGSGWRVSSAHSSAGKDVCFDDTDDDHLVDREVGSALAAVAENMDLFGYDCCLMGMIECAYEVADEASVFVASEATEPVAGWPYDDILADLTANPAWTASQLGADIVVRYGESSGKIHTLSAVDLSVLADDYPDGVAASVSQLASVTMSDATDGDYNRLQDHRSNCSYFDDRDYRDLGTFLSAVAADGALTASISAAAQAALDAYNNSLIENYSGPGQGATGMSIYFQSAGVSPDSNYESSTLEFASDTKWDEFLAWWESGPTPQAPDLLGTSFAADPRAVAGVATTEVTFQVQNQGNEDALAFDIEFFWSDDADLENGDEIPADLDPTDPNYDAGNPNAYRVLAGLPHGESVLDTVSISVPASDPFGSGGVYYLGMRVDESAEVAEYDETNNTNRGQGLDQSLAFYLSVIYDANMDADPGWTLDPGSGRYQWEWGTPTGGGSSGGDPVSGCTANNVIGYNLYGDYANNLGSTQYAMTPAIDCTAYEEVSFGFCRWLGIESSQYDQANIQASNDGSTWVDVWEHTGGSFAEDSWSYHHYDISAVANDQATVYIRWGMGPTDGSVTYPGWNIDDVTVFGTPVHSGEIHGSKWQDLDNDGEWDIGEPGLEGWTIYLDANDNSTLDPGEESTATGHDGSYCLSNLAPGTYLVREQLLHAGWQQTFPAGGSYSIVLADGEHATEKHFGNYCPPIAPIGSHEYADGVIVSLYDVDPADGVSDPDIAWYPAEFVRGVTDVFVNPGRIGDGTISFIALYGDGTETADVGIIVEGNTSLTRFLDLRTGTPPVGFLASEGDVGIVTLKAGVTGANLNGFTSEGAWTLPDDIDDDGNTEDLTAVYVAGGLGALISYGDVDGEVVVNGNLSVLYVLGADLNADVVLTGSDLGKVVVRAGYDRVVRIWSGGSIAGDILSSGSIGLVFAIGGDISGDVEATTGGILRVAASAVRQGSAWQGGGISGDIDAGGDIGVVSAVGSNITGDITAGGGITGVIARAVYGSAGWTGGEIGGAVSAAGNIRVVFAVGGDISGDVTTAGGSVTAVSSRGLYDRLRRTYTGGSVTGDISADLRLYSLYAFEDLTGAIDVGGDLGKVSVRGDVHDAGIDVGGGLTSIWVGGDMTTTDVTVGGFLRSLYVAGDFENSSVQAGTLWRVLVRGVISQDDSDGDTDEIHADSGRFYAMDATWRGWIDSANDHDFADLRAWVGDPL